MSAIGPIHDNYCDGVAAMKAGNYLCAARYFRICYLFYEEDELPYWYEEKDCHGGDAIFMFWKCRSKLTDEAQGMLQDEWKKYGGNWNDMVDYDCEMIGKEYNQPSPNRPKKGLAKLLVLLKRFF